MDNGIRVELAQTSFVARPGETVSATCTVYNTSLIVDDYAITVTGIDPSWYEAPEATARIFPSASTTVPVTFSPPRAATVTAGSYPITITATSHDNPALSASVAGTLTIDSFVVFGFDLDGPRQQSGEVEGSFAFRLTNTGNARLTISLDASEETGQFEFAFFEQSIQVPAGTVRKATLLVRPKPSHSDRAAICQITVGATIAEISQAQRVPEDQRRRTTQVVFQTISTSVEPPLLSPQSIELTGQGALTEIVLRNKSAIPRSMALAGSDRAGALSFEFAGGNHVTIPSQGELRVSVRITCLDRTRQAALPNPTAFAIVATPLRPGGDPQTVYGELTQPAPTDFRLGLVPELVESNAVEQVQLTIQNLSPRSAIFIIATISKDGSLAVTPWSDRIQVAANDRAALPVRLTPNIQAIMATTAGRPREFAVEVTPVDAAANAKFVIGRYIFIPAQRAAPPLRKSRGRNLFTVILLLAALAAGAIAYNSMKNDDDDKDGPNSGGGAIATKTPRAEATSDIEGGGDDDVEEPTRTPRSEDPTNTPRSENTGETLIVNADDVNLRPQPSVDFEPVTTLAEGTEVQSLGEQEIDSDGNVWIKVRVIDSGDEGWIIEEFLDESDGATTSGGNADESGRDLAVAHVRFDPEQPVQDENFFWAVGAENRGTLKTNDFEIDVVIVDVNRGFTYENPIEEQEGLLQFDNFQVYESPLAKVRCPGPHELRVTFSVGADDLDPTNNRYTQAFMVRPNPNGSSNAC